MGLSYPYNLNTCGGFRCDDYGRSLGPVDSFSMGMPYPIPLDTEPAPEIPATPDPTPTPVPEGA